MKEIREILDQVAALADGERAVLATVIDVRGSGYRLPGARMLISTNGKTFGTVSGGCLEADVIERAKNVFDTGKATVFTYDTTKDDDSVFGLNMGCRGVIRILLEAVAKDAAVIRALASSIRERRETAIATLVDAVGETDVKIGGHSIFGDDGVFLSDGLPVSVGNSEQLQDEIDAFCTSGAEHCFRTIGTPEGWFEFTFERLRAPISVLLFGAGADAVPFVRLASELGWQVTVHDHRPAYLTEERFPAAAGLVLGSVEDRPVTIDDDSRTAAVIMTHNYGRDRAVLPALLRSNVFYIGALGPRRRTEQILEEVTAAGDTFNHDQYARLYAPAGLDTGADTPEGIALSIIGEILGVLRQRRGGHLRDRQGSIYDR